MRMRFTSACAVLACIFAPILVAAAGPAAAAQPAQASTRTGKTIEIILTTARPVTVIPVTAPRPSGGYVVQRGDTLAGIAARLGLGGGWPALYAANRPLIGPDAAIIRPGTVLAVPNPAAPAPGKPAPGKPVPGHSRPRPASPPAPPAGHRHHPRPPSSAAPARTGMPGWLKTLLVAVGLLILAAFAAEPVLAIRRRKQTAARTGRTAARTGRTAARTGRTAARTGQTPPAGRAQPPGLPPASRAQPPASQPPAAPRAHIVLADHDRLVVTRSKPDDIIYVLRPPGEDPQAILGVARLVLPEGPYGQLAERLGVTTGGPAA